MQNSNSTFMEKLLYANPCRIVGAYDASSALLIENAGFDAIWASGLCISATLGVPDANIMSFDAFLAVVRAMKRTTTIPILADCENGYGDFHNVIHIVQELSRVGINGICMEDKLFPKLNSFCDHREQNLEDPKDFAIKIRVAAENRFSSDFIVVARIEALIAGSGMNDALERAELYRCAGADAIVIHSKSKKADEVLEFTRLWGNRLPVIVIPTTYPTLDLTEIREHQISGVIYANQVMRAAVYSIQCYLEQLREAQSASSCPQPLASVQDILALQGMDKYKSEETLYRDIEIARVI